MEAQLKVQAEKSKASLLPYAAARTTPHNAIIAQSLFQRCRSHSYRCNPLLHAYPHPISTIPPPPQDRTRLHTQLMAALQVHLNFISFHVFLILLSPPHFWRTSSLVLCACVVVERLQICDVLLHCRLHNVLLMISPPFHQYLSTLLLVPLLPLLPPPTFH